MLQGEAFSYVVEPVGSSVQLDCVVHGAPAPDIRWIKDSLPLRGSRLHYRLQNGSLTIRRTEARRDPMPWGGDNLQPFLMASEGSSGYHGLLQSTKHLPTHDPDSPHH